MKKTENRKKKIYRLFISINVFLVTLSMAMSNFPISLSTTYLRSKEKIMDAGENRTSPLASKTNALDYQVATGVSNGPLNIDPDNPRYFTDGSGNAVLLTGSHTWSNLQDNGGSYPPPVFDYTAYLDFLEENNHNFFRLWTWEQARWTSETTDDNYWFYPMTPFQRTGPGAALDGKAKFNLNKFDQTYFDRMRQRIIEADKRGIYVSIMLFNGWSVTEGDPRYGAGKNNPWKGHPFNIHNNVNGINGDTNGDDQGLESHTLSVPAITDIQKAYIRKVINTVNDLDNVLYEICNECDLSSKNWQYQMINYIHTYEKGKPKQHPVGMTHVGDDNALRESPADWISIWNDGSLIPPVADGQKVSVLDTDHICGVCGSRAWAWEAFTRGHNPIFMDAYDGAGYGVGGAGFVFDDPRWVDTRANMGYVLTYANRINLEAMVPHPDLCSTKYCLANPGAEVGEYLVYIPDGVVSARVDLSNTPVEMAVEWFNPENGTTIDVPAVLGGDTQTFTAPFDGDAVLYLYNIVHTPPTPTNTDTPISPTLTQTSTVLPVTQEPVTDTPSIATSTPTPHAPPVTCVQGFLFLAVFPFFIVIWSRFFR